MSMKRLGSAHGTPAPTWTDPSTGTGRQPDFPPDHGPVSRTSCRESPLRVLGTGQTVKLSTTRAGGDVPMRDSSDTTSGGWRPSGGCSLFVCDIASFGHASRTDGVQEHLRAVMYAALRGSFDDAKVGYDQ